jgi:hypothetical protein
MVSPNRIRHTTPSTMRRLSLVCSLGCIIVFALSSRVILLPYSLAFHRANPSARSRQAGQRPQP